MAADDLLRIWVDYNGIGTSASSVDGTPPQWFYFAA
jgi:hypothetical protein